MCVCVIHSSRMVYASNDQLDKRTLYLYVTCVVQHVCGVQKHVAKENGLRELSYMQALQLQVIAPIPIYRLFEGS